MKTITKCEHEVFLAVFYLGEDATMRNVLCRVNEEYGHTWHPQTVSTFLRRLVQKGYLTMYRYGRTAYYIPEISIQEYQRQCVANMCQILFAGDAGAFAECVQEIGS